MTSLSRLVQYFYQTILSPKPVRAAVHAGLRAIIPESIRVEGRTFYLDKTDPVVSGALALGVYENEEVRLFASLVRPGMKVVDAGAHIGLYSVIAATRGASVIAFEPEPRNRALLQKNAVGLPITIVPKAIADRDGATELYLHPDNKGRHSLIGEGEHVRVETTTLPADADIIKMDIEGVEPLAIEGARAAIEVHRPIIFMEFAPERWRRVGHAPEAALAWLLSIQYQIREIGGGEIRDPAAYLRGFKGERYADLLCTPYPL